MHVWYAHLGLQKYAIYLITFRIALGIHHHLIIYKPEYSYMLRFVNNINLLPKHLG